MKLILIALLTLFVYSSADEIQRIESVVNDIKKLRVDYEKSQDDLSLALVKLKDERDKNAILLNELKMAENKSDKLVNQIKILEKTQKLQKTANLNNKENDLICLKNQIIDKSEFPKLQMKNPQPLSEVIDTQAQTFRLNKDANIYDSVNGNKIAQWEERTSFTSNQRLESWIKITGYFVDKVWQKSTLDLWVKEEDASKR